MIHDLTPHLPRSKGEEISRERADSANVHVQRPGNQRLSGPPIVRQQVSRIGANTHNGSKMRGHTPSDSAGNSSAGTGPGMTTKPSISSARAAASGRDALAIMRNHCSCDRRQRSRTRHAPRPCVKAKRNVSPDGVLVNDSHIVTAGPKPVSSTIHVRPPSIEVMTPRSVPR